MSVSDPYIVQAMILLGILVALITSLVVYYITLKRYPGTALLKLKIGEIYKVRAMLGEESSDDKKSISFWLLLLEDHKGKVRYYKVSKDKLPEISLGNTIAQMTDGTIYNL